MFVKYSLILPQIQFIINLSSVLKDSDLFSVITKTSEWRMSMYLSCLRIDTAVERCAESLIE